MIGPPMSEPARPDQSKPDHGKLRRIAIRLAIAIVGAIVGWRNGYRGRAAALFWMGTILTTGLVILALAGIHHHAAARRESAGQLLGFTTAPMPPPAHGLVVTSLRSGSEAEHDGIAVGDRIDTIEHEPVSAPDDIDRLLQSHGNDWLVLHLAHNGTPRDVVLWQVRRRFHGA